MNESHRALPVVRIEHVEDDLYRVWIDSDKRSPYRIRAGGSDARSADDDASSVESIDTDADDVDHGFRVYGLAFRRVVALVAELHRVRRGLSE